MSVFTTRPELRGTFGWSPPTHWLASQAGMRCTIGWKRVRRSVRTGFVLQVVEPHLNGPVVEMPAVIYSADRDEVRVLCGQGVAPRAATIERFYELGHRRVPVPACWQPAYPAPSAPGSAPPRVRDVALGTSSSSPSDTRRGLSARSRSAHDDRPHRRAARDLARLPDLPARPRDRLALSQPCAGAPTAASSRESWRVAGGGDRAALGWRSTRGSSPRRWTGAVPPKEDF